MTTSPTFFYICPTCNEAWYSDKEWMYCKCGTPSHGKRRMPDKEEINLVPGTKSITYFTKKGFHYQTTEDTTKFDYSNAQEFAMWNRELSSIERALLADGKKPKEVAPEALLYYWARTSVDTDKALDKQEGGDHYKSFAIQPIEFITKNRLGFIEGNVIKYVCRHRSKNGVEDIKKAIHYLQLLLELEYKQ